MYDSEMSATEFKSFLERAGLTVIDVAAATKIHPQTVTRFLKGGRVHISTRTILEHFVAKRTSLAEEPRQGNG